MISSKANYVGIDIGSYAIKVAQVKTSAKSVSIDNLAYEIIPEEVRRGGKFDQIEPIVRGALQKVSKGKSTPVFALPSSAAIMRRISLPAGLTDDEMEGNVELELSNSLPFPIDQVYFDFVADKRKDADGNVGVLTVAGRRQAVDMRINTLSSVIKKYNGQAVDIDCFAYLRCIEKLGTQLSESEGVFLIDVGYKNTRVYAYNSTGLIFNRELQIGGNSVTEMIADTYGIAYGEAETKKVSQNLNPDFNELILKPHLSAFIEQIKLAKDFFDASTKGAVNITEVYLTGGGTQLQGFFAGLQAGLGSNAIMIPVGERGGYKVGGKTKSQTGGSLPVLQANFIQAIGLSIN